MRTCYKTQSLVVTIADRFVKTHLCVLSGLFSYSQIMSTYNPGMPATTANFASCIKDVNDSTSHKKKGGAT